MKDRMVLVTGAAGNAAAFQIGLGIGLDRGLPRLCQRHRRLRRLRRLSTPNQRFFLENRYDRYNNQSARALWRHGPHRPDQVGARDNHAGRSDADCRSARTTRPVHTRGILATAELATAAGLEPSMRVLDLGCGIGGPARYLAATFGCKVTGVDLSPSFIDAATYLTARCGLSDRVTFRVGDALHLPFEDAAFDVVFLQHVAMNVEDRTTLYADVRRILAPGGRLATFDLVLRDGDVVYPAPWARDASTSFLLSEGDTRTALERAGFKPVLWRDDTQTASTGSKR